MSSLPTSSETTPPQIGLDKSPSRLAIALLVIGFFLTSLYIFSRHNDFPFYAHPDERGKAAQVLDHSRNFHHPLLMLSVASQVTRVVKDWQNRKPTYQETVQIGRWIAVVFAAGAVGMLVFTLLRLSGWFGAISLGIVLCLDPALFYVAHFMKEDPPLLFSFGLLFLCCTFFNRKPSGLTIFLMGCAEGLVCSSKYTGLISLLIIIPFVGLRVWQNIREEKSTLSLMPSMLLFGAGLLGVFLLFNFPIFFQQAKFQAGFGREVTEVIVGPHGVRTINVPHDLYFRMLWSYLPVWIWPLIAVYLWLIFRMKARERTEHLVPFLSVLALLIMISFSPKISDRYLQPVQLVALLEACCLAGFLYQNRLPMPKILGKILAVLIIAALCFSQWTGKEPSRPGFKDTYASFQTDSYKDIRDWIRANVSPDAVLLQPEKRFLPDPVLGFYNDVEKDLPQKIYSQSTFIKSGSLQSARAVGVTHIVVVYGATKKYVGPVLSATETAKIDRTRRAKFFDEMKNNSRCIYTEMPDNANLLLHPGFEIYELNPLSVTAPSLRPTYAISASEMANGGVNDRM